MTDTIPVTIRAANHTGFDATPKRVIAGRNGVASFVAAMEAVERTLNQWHNLQRSSIQAVGWECIRREWFERIHDNQTHLHSFSFLKRRVVEWERRMD